MSKSLKMTYVTVNNAHIAELINAVKIIISKQKQQMTAFIEASMYITTLKFEAATAAAEFLLIHEVSTCLAREIVIRCFNAISEDYI